MAAGALKLGSARYWAPSNSRSTPRQRIASRYPAAEPIPEPPLLDDLLRAGIELVWDGDGADGRGCYRPGICCTSPLRRPRPCRGTARLCSPDCPRHSDVDAARALEERLAAALTDHRFLVLTVAQRYLLRAEDEIVRRFPVMRMSLESMLLQEMKDGDGSRGALGSGPAGRCGHARGPDWRPPADPGARRHAGR